MNVEERLERIEQSLMTINGELGELKGKVETENLLIKWVIFPLLTIVAALVGIKLLRP
jgi:hypothetical protein